MPAKIRFARLSSEDAIGSSAIRWSGAQASANLYSLLQTCAANGLDGYAYLRALLIALPNAQTADDYEALLPWRLKLPGR